MPPPIPKRYKATLTQTEILTLLRNETYRVNRETGDIEGPRGIVTPCPDEAGYQFVRLYSGSKRKSIAVGRLVWMGVTLQAIPRHFEIHHRDEIKSNNC